jgi:uncharacterized protein (TIRG00374 family)
MKLEMHQRERIIILSVVVLILFGVLLVVLDWRNVRLLVGQANWKLTIAALFFVALSYLFLSYSFVVVNNIFGVRLRKRDLLEIGYVSATLNNLLAFLGAAGHSLRIMLMNKKGIGAEQALAASIFHSHFHNLVMFCLLPLGLIYMIMHHSVSGSSTISLGLATGVLLFLVVIATGIVFYRALRLKVLHTINRVSCLVIRRNVEPSLLSFDNAMTLGVAEIRRSPLVIMPVLVLISADWASSVTALWFCFYALGNPIHLGVLITGFAVGITAGNVSMVPGGLGVQDASMAGVYALLGVSFEHAVLASILFRVVIDFVPFLFSLLFYRRLLEAAEETVIPGVKGKHQI